MHKTNKIVRSSKETQMQLKEIKEAVLQTLQHSHNQHTLHQEVHIYNQIIIQTQQISIHLNTITIINSNSSHYQYHHQDQIHNQVSQNIQVNHLIIIQQDGLALLIEEVECMQWNVAIARVKMKVLVHR